MSLRQLVLMILALIVGVSSSPARPQSSMALSSQHRRFPYVFSNFVWWSDADLRVALKQRVPSLGNELTEDSSEEKSVRTALAALLKEKGVEADVQVFSPPYDVRSMKQAPDAPPPSILFSVASPPDILVDRVLLDGAPQDVSNSLDATVNQMQGRPYQANSLWADAQKMEQGLYQIGYLSAKVHFKSGTPVRDDLRYLVPVSAIITPGPKYRVSVVKGNGGPLLIGKDLSPLFSLKPGDVATPFAFGRLMGAIRSTYWHAGYPDVELLGDPVLDAEHALASYQLVVNPGPLYHLRSVKIENLTEEQGRLVGGLLGMKSGAVYDAMAVVGLNSKLAQRDSALKGYGFSYNAREDKEAHFVDLTLSFYKQ